MVQGKKCAQYSAENTADPFPRDDFLSSAPVEKCEVCELSSIKSAALLLKPSQINFHFLTLFWVQEEMSQNDIQKLG